MTNTAKNMSEKEKAKRYDEALEEAKKWHKTFVAGQNYPATDIKVSYEWIFPELKKFKDEEIKGAILHFISHTPTVPKGLISKKDMIGWVEKQGEKKDIHLIELKAKAYDDAKERMSYAYNKNRVSIEFVNEIFPDIKLYELHANQDEQKPAD